MIGGSGSLGLPYAFGQESNQPALDATALSGSSLGCALNPLRPYVTQHPLPWAAATNSSGPQKFDLLNWESHEGNRTPAKDLPSGTFAINRQASAGTVSYTAVRTQADDVLTTNFQCANDAWHTPQTWTSERHPTMTTPFPLSYTLKGSFAGGKLDSGRDPVLPVTIPVTTLAALTATIPVLEYAAKANTPFYAITETGLVIGPMQATAQEPIKGPDGQPLYKVVALWGPRTVPTHVVYDSNGTAALTGLLMSAVRNPLS